MPILWPLLLGLSLLAPRAEEQSSSGPDVAHLRELLLDRNSPRSQSQAALLLVRAREAEAEKAVREGLRQADDADVFLALASAVRLEQDNRFLDDLLAALPNNRPGIRQAAAEALAVLTDPQLVPLLQAVVEDSRADLVVRQAALWTLGRCGRRDAAAVLLEQLGTDQDALRRTAAEALADLSGQDLGLDVAAWRGWWDRHRDLSAERWLEQRLSYQASRARRLEGDLERARAQNLRLHQQLYARLAMADRPAYVQALVDHESPAVRTMAVIWSVELLPTVEPPARRALTQVLLRLSQDGTVEVQRAAVLGLGRVNDAAASERLYTLLQTGPPPVRSAAARSLAVWARGGPDAAARQRAAIAALQKALDDPALEVVVEAAEDLGALGALEAGPVLIGLLKHPSEPVRQTAAQALERVADVSVLDGLLDDLDDPACTVRFSLLGAVARVVGDGSRLSGEQRKKLLERLETLLLRDADGGVRSRAATVLGDCAPEEMLATLWRCVLSGEDARVQEKAWFAFMEILARSGNAALLREWDGKLVEARQSGRRLQLLAEAEARWRRKPGLQEQAAMALDALIAAQLDLGKWPAAGPLVRDQLARGGNDADMKRRLLWLLRVGELALADGNRGEALRAVQDAQPHVARCGLAEAFEKLGQRAGME